MPPKTAIGTVDQTLIASKKRRINNLMKIIKLEWTVNSGPARPPGAAINKGDHLRIQRQGWPKVLSICPQTALARVERSSHTTAIKGRVLTASTSFCFLFCCMVELPESP